MSNIQYKTIFIKDLDKYPEWNVKERFHESAQVLMCKRSDMPVDKCEHLDCAQLKGHKSLYEIGKVEKAIIYKE